MDHLRCHTFLQDTDFIPEIRAGGDKADRAISCLYLRYRERTYAYIHSLISKNSMYKGVADDLVQDGFIIMIEKIREENVRVTSLAGYWIGISKMLFLNQLKKDRRLVQMHDMEEPYGWDQFSPESILYDSEEHYTLEKAFEQLGSRCKEVLMLWINQYSMHEIAEKMNLSSDAMARKIKFQCFKKLKILVRSQNPSTSKNIQ